MKRSNPEFGLLLVLLMVVLCGVPSGLAAAAPAPAAPTSYDFSRHFREPLGWPLAGEFGPGKDGRKAAIAAWSRKAANLYVWDYWNVPRWNKGQYGAPAIYPHAVKESFLLEQGRVRGRAIELTQFDSEGRDVTQIQGRGAWADWMYDSLNVYVAFRLMWNMNEDVDVMLDEFYREFYGPAGPSVRRFYEEMERAYLLPRRDAGWDWSAIWLETYPPDFVAKTMGYLREAERASRGQELYHARTVKTLEGFAPMERVSRWYTGGAKASGK